MSKQQKFDLAHWVTLISELFAVVAALLYAENRLTRVETTLDILVKTQSDNIAKIASKVDKIDTLDIRIGMCEKALRKDLRASNDDINKTTSP